ncbi:MAG: site-specific integrase, partial [bacterium]|nr:site-specific integrase [bacterium]
MKGYIRQRSKGVFEITVDVGNDPATGQRIRHYETVRGTRRQAEVRKAEIIISLDRGSYVKPQRIPLREWMSQWLEGYVRRCCAPRTYEGYERNVRCHINPALGSIMLTELRAEHLDALYSKLLKDGRIDGKGGLSAQSVKHIHRILSEALTFAVKRGLLFRNIADLVDPPRISHFERKALTPEELGRLMEAAR